MLMLAQTDFAACVFAMFFALHEYLTMAMLYENAELGKRTLGMPPANVTIVLKLNNLCCFRLATSL